MSEQGNKQAASSQRHTSSKRKSGHSTNRTGQRIAPSLSPASEDRETWMGYWQNLGQPWRTEPEVDIKRQAYLSKRRSITPDIEQGIYPFGGITLSRADIEWLLATHENGRGPVDLSDELQRERRGLDLRGAILEDADLRALPLAHLCGGIAYIQNDEPAHVTRDQHYKARVHLDRAKLDNADLREAELYGASFYGASLERANLFKSHLEEANFGKAILKQTQLTQVYFKGADLRKAQLEEIQLGYANLEDAQLRGAIISRGFFNGATLKKADMREIQISRADFSGAHLEDADLRQATINCTIFYAGHLEGAWLEGSSLSGCNLVEAHLEEAFLHKAHLEKTDLSKAHLESANLLEASLGEALLIESHLEGANLIKAHLEKASLIKAHLEAAHVSGAYLNEALLTSVHLAGADLREAHLEGADLREAHLEGVRVADDILTYTRQWISNFPETLPPANLRRAFFDSATKLDGVVLGDKQYGFAALADISWGDVNLAVVNWSQVKMPGDEFEAQQLKDKAEQEKDYYIQSQECQTAVRANRQLSVALQTQGLNETAIAFAYRAQKLQRKVLLLQSLLRPTQQKEHLWLFNLLEWLRKRIVERPIPFVSLVMLLLATLLVLQIFQPGLQYPLSLSAIVHLFFVSMLQLLIVILLIFLMVPQNLRLLLFLLFLLLLILILILLALFILSLIPLLLLVALYSLLLMLSPSVAHLTLVSSLLPLLPLLLLFLLVYLISLLPYNWVKYLKQKLQRFFDYIPSLLRLLGNTLVDNWRIAFSAFLDKLAGYGYRPELTLFWYLGVVSGFAIAYSVFGNFPLFPDAFVLSLTSFHGRGLFPGIDKASLHSSLVVLAALEAVVGLLIEISFIATFTQRFLGK